MLGKRFRVFIIRPFQQMKEFYTPTNVILGRWNIENCEKRVFTKTDYSNEDHCGTCSIHFAFERGHSSLFVEAYLTYSPMQKAMHENLLITANPKEKSENDDESYKYYLL